MQTQKPNQKDDQYKQGKKDLSGQSKNVTSKNELNSKKDTQPNLNVDKDMPAKDRSKNTTTSKDR